MEYIIYDKLTGAGICKKTKPDSEGPPFDLDLSFGEEFTYVSFDISTQLFLDGQVIEKPESKITINKTSAKALAESIILSNIPNPTIFKMSGNTQTFWQIITDGICEFILDTPGEYTIICESKIELPIVFEVTII